MNYEPGDILANGALVLHARAMPTHHDTVVLAFVVESAHQPFVIWNVSERGIAIWGHYFDNVIDAVEDFNMRTTAPSRFRPLSRSFSRLPRAL